MLDRHVVPLLRRPLAAGAAVLDRRGVGADAVTVAGFLIGLLAIGCIAMQAWTAGLVALILNRLCDGLDGEIARRRGTKNDGGAFLDITLDFAFYALFPLGFAFADPAANALPAAVLIASFVGTGSSFLAFSSFAKQREIEHPDFAYKGLYYLDGLAEGTETILCFVAMCLWPAHFALIAWVFATLCAVTAANRVWSGYRSLR